MKTPFDSIFDFDHDGKLSGFEQASRDAFIISEILNGEDESGDDADESESDDI